MKFPRNLAKVARLKPDYLGFIFYEKSPRFMQDTLAPEHLRSLPKRTKRAGVFVDADTAYMLDMAQRYGLHVLQLHGNESPEQCRQLKSKGYQITKVFSIGKEDFDFTALKPYKPYADYFLFDTKGRQPGGNGITFDWSKLRQYNNKLPFFLSGGVSLDNIDQLRALNYLNLHAVDVNSQFEIEPGMKDIDKLKMLVEQMK